MIVYGTHTYGKVNEIDGIGYVATQFFMLNYFPIFPVGSYFVTSQEGDSINGIRLPLHAKSIGVAYLRALLAVVALAGVIFLLIGLSDIGKGNGGWLATLSGGAAVLFGGALFFATYRLAFFSKATYEQAIHIANLCDFSTQGRLMLEVHYGRMSADAAADVLLQEEATMAELVDPTMGQGGANSV